jgi:hypothetical protein
MELHHFFEETLLLGLREEGAMTEVRARGERDDGQLADLCNSWPCIGDINPKNILVRKRGW